MKIDSTKNQTNFGMSWKQKKVKRLGSEVVDIVTDIIREDGNKNINSSEISSMARYNDVEFRPNIWNNKLIIQIFNKNEKGISKIIKSIFGEKTKIEKKEVNKTTIEEILEKLRNNAIIRKTYNKKTTKGEERTLNYVIKSANQIINANK